MLGATGLKFATQVALLNANYAMARLQDHYRVKFVNNKGRCAHEFIIDLAEFEDTAGLKVMDIAKRLQDYGIHPPTCSWPLSTAMLVSRLLSPEAFLVPRLTDPARRRRRLNPLSRKDFVTSIGESELSCLNRTCSR